MVSAKVTYLLVTVIDQLNVILVAASVGAKFNFFSPLTLAENAVETTT